MKTNSAKPVKVIIDTDVGSDVDDAFALAYALRRPELDIRGITTVYGPVAERTAIVAKLLQTLGREDVPHATGAGNPLVGTAWDAIKANHHGIVRPGEKLPPPACADAQELFRRVIGENPGEVWLVGIGPMTNLATLIRDHPETAAKLAGIACMGGEPTRPFAEFNIRLDAEAADLVARSGRLKFLGTYDVTKRVTMDDADLARLEAAGTPTARLLLECVRLWRPHTDKPGPIVYDMCPLTWLFAPKLFTTRQHGLAVSLEPAERRGMMSPAENAPPAAVSTDIDAAAAQRLLMETLTLP